MSKIDELERRVEALERGLSDQKEWVLNREAAEDAAQGIDLAIDWNSCPKRPCDFVTWTELYDWLDDIAKEE